MVDFRALNKPLLMYAAQFSDPDAFRAAHPTAQAAYVVDRDLARLDTALGKDPLTSERADYYRGGPHRTDPPRRFIGLIEKLAEDTGAV